MSGDPVRIETLPGNEITRTIKRAIEDAAILVGLVAFDFNGVEVVVAADSSPDLIYRDWNRGMSGYHKDVVGPYLPAELSAETIPTDERIKVENEARWAAQRAEREAEQRQKRALFRGEVQGTEIDIQPGKLTEWVQFIETNSGDSYSKRVVIYAEQWARLMQARMRDGRPLSEVVEQASRDADTDGIAGFMFGRAVSALAQVWRHGEALRQWHNLKTQIGSEGERANESGGVLNPALLSIA